MLELSFEGADVCNVYFAGTVHSAYTVYDAHVYDVHIVYTVNIAHCSGAEVQEAPSVHWLHRSETGVLTSLFHEPLLYRVSLSICIYDNIYMYTHSSCGNEDSNFCDSVLAGDTIAQ